MQDNGFREPDWKERDAETGSPSPENMPEEGYYTYDAPPSPGQQAPFVQPGWTSGGPLRSVEVSSEGEYVNAPSPASAPYEYYDEPEQAAPAADLSGFAKAGFWVRFSAWLLDGFISGIPGLLLAGLLLLFGGDWASKAVFFALTPARIAILAARAVYRVATTALFGGTLGKLALKLKVVSTETGEAPTFWQSFFRETFGKYLSSVCLCIGYLMVFSEKGTLHDRLADTAVVYDL